MGYFNTLLTSQESRIPLWISTAIIIILVISSLLFQDHQKNLWISIIVISCVCLVYCFITPVWVSTSTSTSPSSEPSQLYNVKSNNVVELSQMLNYIKLAQGKDIKVNSYTTNKNGTYMQFSATGLRDMSIVTFVDTVKYKEAKFLIQDNLLCLTGAIPFLNGPTNDETFPVYVWVFAGTTIRDENSTIPSDRDPGYSNGKFDDAPLVIVKNLPVMEGYTFKITPINELSDCGYLSVNIEDYWYNLYYLSDSSQYQYYTNIIIGTKPLTYKVIENVDLSCMCDGDSKFMKNNPFQLTYPPEYEIKYTNNQNCQMINAFNILFLKNALQNVKTDINSIGITRKQIQKICPTYFKECEDSSTCKYTSCDEIKDDTIPPYCSDDIQMDSYDWGPDPEVSGETSLEKLFNCIDTKIRDRFNKLSICDLEKLYYTDCKFLVDPLTVNYASLENNDKIPPDIAETLAKMLLIGNIVDLPCTYSSAGYGLKIGDYIKQQLGVSGNFPDIKATQQLQSQCCKSTNA